VSEDTAHVIRVPLLTDSGGTGGFVCLFSEWRSPPALREVPAAEAATHGEETVQLVEGFIYEYELEPGSLRLDSFGTTGIVTVSSNPAKRNTGRLQPGSFLGRLILVARDGSGRESGRCALEVTSNKLDYRTEYRQMIDDIVEQSIDLAFNVLSPTELKVTPSPGADLPSLTQQLAFLRAFVTSSTFRNSIDRILTSPHRRLRRYEIQQDPRHGVRPSASTIRRLARASRRVPVPLSHPIAVRVSSLPSEIPIVTYDDTLDTVENRFVKFALQTFSGFLAAIRGRLLSLGGDNARRVAEDALRVQTELERALGADLFRDLSALHFLPLGSSVLQQKEGYREILRSWMRFDVAARVHWAGGDDVFGAGQKNVATLYEYWVFFRLVRVFTDLCGKTFPAANELVETTGDGCLLRLRSGRQITLNAECHLGEVPVKLRLDYNRVFVRHESRERAGSWTRRMRPDYTLSIWPVALDEREAEKQGLLSHVHFDAKYRIQWIAELFGADDADMDTALVARDLESEKREEAVGIYRRADLLKMHAYKDAVRRSYGAYVIYPGATTRVWREFDELLPGLGAFSLAPGKEGRCLADFLADVVRYSASRFSGASVSP
jgi:predicted component of viral defense system (DUF524 family)